MSKIEELLNNNNRTDFTEILKEYADNELLSKLSYDQLLNKSFDSFYSSLKQLYPDTDRDNDQLYDIVTDLTYTHNEIYFRLGLMIGFNIFKQLE